MSAEFDFMREPFAAYAASQHKAVRELTRMAVDSVEEGKPHDADLARELTSKHRFLARVFETPGGGD